LHLDENALKLMGISTAAVTANQTVSVSGTERDQYSFGAWMRSIDNIKLPAMIKKNYHSR